MTEWVPVVDISRHQGPTDFAKMRAKGVRGVILRISHGLTLDSRADDYYHGALGAGFAPAEIGWYPFINPKRGSGADTAEFAVESILQISGQRDFLYMLDVENYANESPDIGQAPVFGPQFADYIREHINTVKALSPKSRVIGYSNRAYWNGKIYKGSVIEWVGDDLLAAELDWIVARYPVYSLAGYAAKPLPLDTTGWADWAFKVAPDGPFPPRGADWAAWQFSAGFNRQGPDYGVTSSDLDLNIVHPDAWARWMGKTAPVPPPFDPPHPQPPQEIDMPTVVTNSEAASYDGKSYPAGVIKYALDRPNIGSDVATKRHLTGSEHAAYGSPVGAWLNNAQLGDLPDFVPDQPAGADPRVDRLETVATQLNDAVGRTGQVVGDIQKGLAEAANARP